MRAAYIRRRRTALRRTRSAGVCIALVFAGILVATQPCVAQSAATGGILLRLHPRVGDTLRTRMEQVTEITSPRTTSGASRSMTMSVLVLARTIVQASRKATTTVLTLVDSADVKSSDAHGEAMSAQAERLLRGQRLIVQLAEDGSVESALDARGVAVPRDVTEAMAAMPAVFPRRTVVVGERWRREMPLPSAGPLGAAGSAQVRAEFRLDSLGKNGELAFVSMHGQIESDGGGRPQEVTGSMTGSMQVDRARGWMTDSHFILVIRSVVMPAAGTGMQPMKFVTKVTQRLRTMDKR